MNIEEYKNNPKTAFLASLYEKTLKEEVEIRKLAEDDPSMKDLVLHDLEAILEQRKSIEQQMNGIVANERKDEEEADKTIDEVVLEVRAGVGGDEAALFATELLDMYKRYAESRGWSLRIIDESKNDLGGYKEVSIEIKGNSNSTESSGDSVYDNLRYETGVHRVQRVPETEKSGRIHTSTASVAILPIRKKSKLELNPADLIIEFSRAGGKGGQNVNKVESAVRIVHKPSGMDVRSTVERSQNANRQRALQLLTARVEAMQEEAEMKKFASERKGQIGNADRSEKIRTYNFPQDRVTDHRIKESWHNIPEIMKGKIGAIITKLREFGA
ncbi:MAG: PCRF domain-containing protein [Candidatus Paceibacterota bacterium]|jgi:peptide chain release factor 1